MGGGGGGGEGRGVGKGGEGETPLGSHLKAPLGLIGSMLLITVTVYILLYIKCCYSATVVYIQCSICKVVKQLCRIALSSKRIVAQWSLEQKKQLILCVLLNYSTVSNLAIDTDGSDRIHIDLG